MQPRPKIRRKPAPAVELAVAADARYPAPDPNDPFAPLWVLRSRNSTNDLKNVYDLYPDLPTRAQSPSVAFPVIHDHVSASSESSNTASTDTDHQPKWHSRLLRRARAPSAFPGASPIPPSESSASTASSFVHVSTPSQSTTYDCCSAADTPASAPEWALPTPSQLARAASLPVIAASGLRVPFAALFAARPTVIVFIRHFWCPHCQDYVSSIARTAPPPSDKNPFDLVVISNGAPAFIPKYRALLGLEFEMYTDPTLGVYTALGMGRSASSSGANGDYARHGTMGGIAMVVLRALKAGLPVWERGGDVHALGGEFVLGPGLTCSYAHRMQSPKGHAPIRTVLAAAGVHVPPSVSAESHSSASASASSAPVPSPSTSTPKLLTALRMKTWAPQRRSSSLGVPPSTKSKTWRKNMSTGTHPLPLPTPILRSRTKTRSPSPSPSPGPMISEFGAWRRTGRVSFDSARALSEGVRRNFDPHPHSPPQSPSQLQSFPYASRHRQYASTATLPIYSSSSSSSSWFSAHRDRRDRARAQDDADALREVEVEVEAWPTFLVPDDESGHGNGNEWMRARMESLDAMRERKRERRAGFVGFYVPRAGAGAGAGGSPERGKGVSARPVSAAVVGCERVEEEGEEEGGRC